MGGMSGQCRLQPHPCSPALGVGGVVIRGRLQTKVSVDCLLRILFERSGARMETASQVVYWVNTAGLSVAYQRLLTEVVAGLCAMDLQEQGKLIRVRLKDLPP